MMRMLKKFLSLIIVCVLLMSMFTACSGQKVKEEEKKELIRLTWYQIGEKQKDADRVLEKVNAYIGEKIGVELTIRYVGWGDYNEKMQAVINTGDQWDLCFTSSWANDFMQNANKGVYLALDDLIREIFTECPVKKKSQICRCGCLQKNMWINITFLMKHCTVWKIWNRGFS